MRYLGGKTRTARRIADTLAETARPGADYWEPFLGGASVAAAVARSGAFQKLHLSDTHPDLVLLWEALVDGWVPPADMSREEYQAHRATTHPSATRGWAGFAASRNGMWMGGYGAVALSAGRNYLAESQRLALRKAEALRLASISLACHGYEEVRPAPGDTVYCDPPYLGTTGYASTAAFDHATFWATCAEWAASGVSVFVSEYEAPADWAPVWSVERSATVSPSITRRRTEHLYSWSLA